MERSWIRFTYGLSEGDVSEVARSACVVRSEQALERSYFPLMDRLADRGEVLRERQPRAERMRACEQVDEDGRDLSRTMMR
jgi:hypothetical protein